MISKIKNVSILVSLLKAHNVKDIVLAPGASDIPIIHVIEKDDFFNCYSIVDERSMVYFAMGISQQMNVPVACVCTSGTAVSNFLPGITEAFYRNTPIIAITGDKDQYRQGQLETQKIEQCNIFGGCCKKSVNLPVVNNDDDAWYCGRLVNEALIEMTHHGAGPVQINIPVIGDISAYSENDLPKCKKIELVEGVYGEKFKVTALEKIKRHQKIMVVVGQDVNFTEDQIHRLDSFAKTYNAMIAVDHLSNIQCDSAVNVYPVVETKKCLSKELLPSLVISVGNNIASYDLKYILRRAEAVEHWQVDESGRIRDVFQHLTTVFECAAADFFDSFECGDDKISAYARAWKHEYDAISIEELPYSSFLIAQQLAKEIPENSILHLAILNSTRLMQYFKLHKGIKTYSNFGALGIDGCLSTFMGQAISTDELAFCLIGDLSFFYDMNAAGIIHRKNNIRIILLNNHGAGEFYFTMGKGKIDTIDKHIAATNNRIAKGWVESLGYEYHSVKCKEDVESVFSNIGKKSDRPIFVEVFLDISEDTQVTKDIYAKYKVYTTKDAVKTVVKNAIGDQGVDFLKKIIRK